jgi:hypothetical protein
VVTSWPPFPPFTKMDFFSAIVIFLHAAYATAPISGPDA